MQRICSVTVACYVFFLGLGLSGFTGGIVAGESSCEDIYQKFAVQRLVAADHIKQIGHSSSQMVRIRFEDGFEGYYKEYLDAASLEEFDRTVFNYIPLLLHAVWFTQGTPISAHVAGAVPFNDGLSVHLDGTEPWGLQPGVLQFARDGLITPINQFQIDHATPDMPSILQIAEVLRQPRWERAYADWMIFSRIFLQADRNIANLTIDSNERVYFFDLADGLNRREVLSRYWHTEDGEEFFLEAEPDHRYYLKPNYAAASEPFKEFARIVASKSPEEIAGMMQLDWQRELVHPRGHVSELMREVQRQATAVVAAIE